MATKSVLLQFLDRKKIYNINSTKEERSDVEYLLKEFIADFPFDCTNNAVTLQRFDSEWGEFVDLDPGSQIDHKDKLLAVLTPNLSIPKDDCFEVRAL